MRGLLLGLLLPACSSAGELTRDALWLTAAAGLDLASTEVALSRCSSCREANPLMQTSGTRVLGKVAGTVAVAGSCELLRRRGHPIAAKVLRWSAVLFWTGAAVHNMRTSR